MANHAYLSASASHRWMACPPSARLCAQEDDRTSEYAIQGSCAHELGQFLVEQALGRECRDPTEDLTYYNAEMQEAAEAYRDFVMEQVNAAKALCREPLVCVEQTLDYSKWVQHGYGTGDCVIVADGLLHVIDLKFGVGILVSADHNNQLMCYALGALDTFGCLYDFDRIRLSIFQPRRDNVDTWETSKAELLRWAEEVLAPVARLAYKGEGEFKAGDHCQFCKVKATCRKRTEYAMELARFDFADPPTLDDDEIAGILPRIDTLVSWAEDVKAWALQQALSGVTYPGWKLVEGRSNRKYSDEAAVAAVVTKAGFDPFEKKLLGFTAMTRQLGKKRFDELLSGLIVKPQGKPVLVPETDKRPVFNTAADDFKEEI